MARAAVQAVPVQIWTLGLIPPVESFSPESTITAPVPSVVAVGYQRPPPIGGKGTNVSVDTLNAEARGWPKNGSYLTVPPTISGLPSLRTTMPLQNMSQAILNV